MKLEINLCTRYLDGPPDFWRPAEAVLRWAEGDFFASKLLETALRAEERGNPGQAETAARALHEWAAKASDDLAEGVYSAVCACALPRALEKMRARGLSEAIIRDTLSDFGVWARTHRRETGRDGFSKIGWELSILAGSLVRLGRLQFEPSQFCAPFTILRHRDSGRLIVVPRGGVKVDAHGWLALGAPEAFTTSFRVCGGRWEFNAVDTARARITRETETVRISKTEPILTAGMHTMNVHIPEVGPLTDEGVEDSLAQAKAFFGAAGYPCGCAVCESWLLDPALMEYGRGCTHLEHFQRRFTLYPELSRVSEAAGRVFGRTTDVSDPDKLSEETRLQRGLKAFLKAKKPMRDAGGILLL